MLFRQINLPIVPIGWYVVLKLNINANITLFNCNVRIKKIEDNLIIKLPSV